MKNKIMLTMVANAWIALFNIFLEDYALLNLILDFENAGMLTPQKCSYSIPWF